MTQLTRVEVARVEVTRVEAAGLSAFRVRAAVPGDRVGVAAMLDRCGPESLFYRFLHPVRSTPVWYVEMTVSSGTGRLALVVEAAGYVIGIGELHQLAPDTAEIGMLIEDRYQRQGVGTQLLGRIVEEAARRDMCALSALVSGENDHVIRMLGRIGALTVVTGPGVREVHVALRPAHPLEATG
jgi:GNAT superfamily N-acetyltransferase